MRWFGSKIPSLMYGAWFIGGFLALAAFGVFIIDLDGGRLSPLEINTFIVTPALKAAIVSVIWIGGLVAGAAMLRHAGT